MDDVTSHVTLNDAVLRLENGTQQFIIGEYDAGTREVNWASGDDLRSKVAKLRDLMTAHTREGDVVVFDHAKGLDSQAFEIAALIAGRVGLARSHPDAHLPAGSMLLRHSESAARASRNANGQRHPREPVPGGDREMAVATSGSTGQPRHVLLSATKLDEGVRAWTTMWPHGRPVVGDTVLALLPLSHVAGKIMSNIMMLLYGTRVAWVRDVSALAQALTDVRPDFFVGVPYVWQHLCARMEVSGDVTIAPALRGMKLLLNAGGLVPAQTNEALRRHGVILYDAYGATETTVPCYFGQVAPRFRGLAPVPGVQGQLRRGDELWVRTPFLATELGPAGPRSLTSPSDAGWWPTGDSAQWMEGNRIRVVGRQSRVRKTRKGLYGTLDGLEEALRSVNDVADVLVVPNEDGSATVIVSSPTSRKFSELRGAITSHYEDCLRSGNYADLPLSRVVVTRDSWHPDSGLVSELGKPRRELIRSRYV